MTQIGRNVTGVQGDVSHLTDLDRLFATVKQQQGHVDVLFANAGVLALAPLASEFAAKSADRALATMTAEPHVNVVPLMIGARGPELHDFYANHFLNQIPPDMEMVTVSRTIGQGRVVDELIARFTHSTRMDWLLPGIAPTGKRVEMPFVVIVQFEGDKLRTSTCTGTRPRCSSRSACSTQHSRFEAGRSRRKC